MRLLEVLQSVYQEHLENHSSGKKSRAEMSNFSSCESCVLGCFWEDFTASIDNSNVSVYMHVYSLCLHNNAILQQN